MGSGECGMGKKAESGGQLLRLSRVALVPRNLGALAGDCLRMLALILLAVADAFGILRGPQVTEL